MSNIGEIKETEDHKKLELSDSELLLQMKRMGQAVIAGVSLDGNNEHLNDGSRNVDPFLDIVRGTTQPDQPTGGTNPDILDGVDGVDPMTM